MFSRFSENAGLIMIMTRWHVVKLAAQHKLPGIYAGRFYPAVGGLMSLGPNFADQFRQAAGYVDGEKPADLAVQAPTKYELIINLKTAKALGLDVTSRAEGTTSGRREREGMDAGIGAKVPAQDRPQ